MYTMELESMAVAPLRSCDGSVRTRFTPIEPEIDEDTHSQRDSFHERSEIALTTPRLPEAGLDSPSASHTNLESSNDGDPSLDKEGIPKNLAPHDGNVGSGIALGIEFGEISLKDAKSSYSRSRFGWGSSLCVSFPDESKRSRSLSTPEITSRPVLRSRTTHASLDCPESLPALVRGEDPFTLGVGAREGTVSGDEPRGSPLPLPESESLHQSCGVSGSGDRGSVFQHSILHARSLESIGEGSKYDSPSNLASGPTVTPGKENLSTSNLNAPSFLLRCNARRQHDEEEDADRNEDMKVGMLCGLPLSDINISGDFVRLLSKLFRLSVPLPKQSVLKASQDRGSEVVGTNTIENSIPPQVFSWETQNSSMPCKDYVIIGRQNSLRLLCERCSSGSTPSYGVHRPRKIRDHEHHQHFYKKISKALDQKLRG